mmetsp:Transcript_65505/g.152090  ORF Transcript_65505/g.152090 Transcript_65505/m.152090 type:complete len:339 (-) Transcript_65505:18-1034(-)
MSTRVLFFALRRASAPQAPLQALRRHKVSAPIIESVDVPGDFPDKQPLKQPDAPRELQELKVGFIGWGAIAQAVSLGLLRQNLVARELLRATDVVPEIHEVAKKHGLSMAGSNTELVRWADVVVVATKPQVADSVIREVRPVWEQAKLLVSICAGVTVDTYLAGLGDAAKVVRVMPNTPCLVGQAATAYAGSAACAEWELKLVHRMFAAVGGATHRVPEYLLNTVTGLSGSGPAYVYMLIQALSDAGVHGGLPRAVSLSLAAQTVAGAARMVQGGQHPAVLKEAVTSPAGTTIAGVRVLEKMSFNSAIIEAVEAARARSEELSRTPDFLFDSKSAARK